MKKSTCVSLLDKLLDSSGPYVSFLFYKAFSGLIYTAAILLFVDDSSALSLVSFLIVYEFYFSYFYTFKKNQVIKDKIKIKSTLFWCSSVAVGCVFYILTDFTSSYYAVMFISLTAFSLYAPIAIINESADVTKWVKVENRSALVSSVTLFIILGLGHIISIDLSFIALGRSGIIFALCFIYARFVSVCNSGGFLELTIREGLLVFIKGSLFVIALLLFKLNYFSDSGQHDSSLSGQDVKYYLAFYDLFAAILGLFLRRAIALSSGDKMHTVSVIGAFALMLSLLLLISLLSGFNFIVASVLFLILAVCYNLLPMLNKREYNAVAFSFLCLACASFIISPHIVGYIFIFINLLLVFIIRFGDGGSRA